MTRKSAENEFVSIYNDITAQFRKLNYQGVIDKIIDIRIPDLPLYTSSSLTLINSINVALIKGKSQDTQLVEHLNNCAVDLVKVILKHKSIKDVADTLYAFSSFEMLFKTNTSHWLEQMVKIIVANLVDKKHDVDIFDVNKCLVSIFRCECAAHQQNCPQTIQFVSECRQLKIFNEFRHFDIQYLDLIELTINLYPANTTDSVKLLEQQLCKLKEINQTNELDLAVTITELMAINLKRKSIAIDEPSIVYLFRILLLLYKKIKQVTYERQMCTASKCEEPIRKHEAVKLGFMAASLFLLTIDMEFSSFNDVFNSFGHLFVNKLIILSSDVKCKSLMKLSIESYKMTEEILRKLTSVRMAGYGLRFLQLYQDKKQSIKNDYLEKKCLRLYQGYLNVCENHVERMQYGYLYQFFLIENLNFSLHNMHCINKTHEQLQTEFQTVDEYLNEENCRKFLKLTLTDTQMIRMLQTQLKCAIKFKQLTAEIQERLLKTIFKLSVGSVQNEFIFLELLLCIDNSLMLKHVKTFEKLIKMVDDNIGALTTAQKINFYAIKGRCRANTYVKQFNTAKEMNKDLQKDKIYVAQMFNGISLAEEEEPQIQMLCSAIRSHKQFVQEILNLKKTDLKEFSDGIESAIDCLQSIGDHLSIRCYNHIAIKSYYLLYKLTAHTETDEFGLIKSVAYFAEHRTLCEQVVGLDQQKIQAIIVECNANLMTNLDQFDKLSLRKQKVIFCALLSMAVFYMDTNQMDMVNDILMYVDREINARKYLFDSVRCKYHSVVFLLRTKYGQADSFSPMCLAEDIVFNAKTIHYTQDEALLVTAILMGLFRTLIEYSLSQYDWKEIELFNWFLLKMARRMGFHKLSVEIIMQTCYVDLYKEDSLTCLEKLQRLVPLLQLGSMPEEIVVEIEKNEKPDSIHLDAIIDDDLCIRKQAVDYDDEEVQVSNQMNIWIDEDETEQSQSANIDSYTMSQHASDCQCLLCANLSIKLLLFECGIMEAQSQCLNYQLALSCRTFEMLSNYWDKHFRPLHNRPTIFPCDQEILTRLSMRLTWFYGQSLQRNDKPNECFEMLKLAQEWTGYMHWSYAKIYKFHIDAEIKCVKLLMISPRLCKEDSKQNKIHSVDQIDNIPKPTKGIANNCSIEIDKETIQNQLNSIKDAPNSPLKNDKIIKKNTKKKGGTLFATAVANKAAHIKSEANAATKTADLRPIRRCRVKM